MKVWQALVTMTALEEGLNENEIERDFPRLKARAYQALRSIGTTQKEMDSEFPDRALYEGLRLIKNDPKEFRRQSMEAMHQIIGNN